MKSNHFLGEILMSYGRIQRMDLLPSIESDEDDGNIASMICNIFNRIGLFDALPRTLKCFVEYTSK